MKKRTFKGIITFLFIATSASVSFADNLQVKERLEMVGQPPNVNKSDQQARRLLTGVVEDQKGEPLVGVNIVIKGTTTGVITDLEGKFSLEVSDLDILQISYVGYNTQLMPIGSKNKTIRICLTEDAKNLDEVVVVGYGIQKKINLTGAIETVKSDKIVRKTVNSLAETLAGEVAGMTVTQRSGQPGNPSIGIRVRGVGTWGNASPLIIVDGVPMDMSNVMPTDVESITVLKDAASSAIYGSRAANGVILITTKRGQKEKVTISYSGNVGVQNPTRLPRMAKSWQYAELYNQSMENEGKSSSLFPAERIQRMKAGGDPDKLEGNTDWYDELVNSAMQQSHNVSFQGGGNKTSYLGSLGYFKQDGMIETSGYKRYNARLNTSTELTKWMTLDTNLSYINDEKSESAAGVGSAYYQASRALPYMPVNYSDGTWSLSSVATNPVRMATKDYGMQYVTGDKVSLLISPSITPIAGLVLKGSFGYEVHTYGHKRFSKTVAYDSFEPSGQAGSVIVPRNEQYDKWEQYRNYTATTTATYEKNIRKHSFKVLAGGSAESYRYRFTEASRKDFPNNDFSEINAGDPNTAMAQGNSSYSSLVSLFGRVNYSFADKYLFEANVRYDGSSKFVVGNQWGVFPSFSLGWRVSEEKFFMPVKHYIQNLKIRGSWGQLGNQQIDDYQGYSTFGSGYSYMFNGSVNAAYGETIMGNQLITWETSTNFNIGVDISVLDNKLNASFDYYRRLTDDILLKLETPALLGISPAMQNAGSVENKGWELSVNWRDHINEKFNYSIGFNLSDVRNKVVDLKGYKSPTNGLTTRIEGEPLDAIYGWKTLGICMDESQYNTYKDQMKSYNATWGIGDLIIEDRNKDGVINATDKTIIGNQIPRFTYGLNLACDYKNWDFSCFIQGVGKVNGYMGSGVFSPLGVESALVDHYESSFNPKNPDPEAYFPRVLNSSRHNYGNFSHWVQNAAYLRLKNIQVGYTFKIPIMGIETLRVGLSGQNLFTLTKFKVFDPESPLNSWTFPNASVYSFSANITF